MQINPANCNNTPEVKAAVTIQRFMRRTWERQGRVFTSQRLDAVAQNAKKFFEETGLSSLGIDEHCTPLDSQPLGFVRVNETFGYFRITPLKNLRNEQICAELISYLGLTSVVYRGRFLAVAIDIEKSWAALKKTASNTEITRSSRILMANSKEERNSYIASLSPSVLREIYNDAELSTDFGVKWRLNFYVRAFIDLAIKPDKQICIPLYLFLPSRSVLHRDDDLKKLSDQAKQELGQYFSEIKPEILGPTSLKGLKGWSENSANDAKFKDRISMKSFEDLICLSLLLNLPSVMPEQLSVSVNPKGEFDLALLFANVRYYPPRSLLIADQNYLVSLPHMNKKVSKRCREMILRWDSSFVDSLNLSSDRKDLIKECIENLKKALKNSDILWSELIYSLKKDWILTRNRLTVIRYHLREVASTMELRKKDPLKGFKDVLRSPPCEHGRANFASHYALKAEVKKAVTHNMPRVIRIVARFVEVNGIPERKAFVAEADVGHDKKFIGKNCCGPTSTALAVFLLSQGFNARRTGSILHDHAFVAIESGHRNAPTLYIDPTFKQLFFHTRRSAEKYWHELDPILIGSSVDFMQFFKKHRVLSDTKFQDHFWIEAKKLERSYEELLRFIVDEKYAARHPMRLTLGRFIKEEMTREELAKFSERKKEIIAKGELKKLEGTSPLSSLKEFVEYGLEPYLQRLIHYVMPDDYQIRSREYRNWDYDLLENVMALSGYLLHKEGFEVHKRGGIEKLEYFPHLAVKEPNGEEWVVSPLLHLSYSLFQRYFDQNNKTVFPMCFVGKKQELEDKIKTWMGAKIKDHFPLGFQLDPDPVNEDYAILQFKDIITDSHELANLARTSQAALLEKIMTEWSVSGEFYLQ